MTSNKLEAEPNNSSNGQGDGFLDDVSFLDDISLDEEEEEIPYTPEIHFSSSESMDEVGNESVHLIVTSPPYNADWSYGSHDDDLDYGEEYLPMLSRVFRECYRVLVPGGRMVVNVPSLLRGGTDGGVAIAADIIVMLNRYENSPWQFSFQENKRDIAKCRGKTEWKIRETITWNKKFNTDGLAPNGSFPRPWGILLNNMHEMAIVFQKPGERDVSNIDDKVIEDSKINKKEDDWCDDVWTITPDSWSPEYVEGEDVPPFPESFVERCIALWSYKDDTVLDPFAGRFTVGKMAKKMDRHSIGYELREELKKDIEEYVGMNQTGITQW